MWLGKEGILVEYNSTVWSPYLKHDINSIEMFSESSQSAFPALGNILTVSGLNYLIYLVYNFATYTFILFGLTGLFLVTLICALMTILC